MMRASIKSNMWCGRANCYEYQPIALAGHYKLTYVAVRILRSFHRLILEYVELLFTFMTKSGQ
jgi:hypothetical protein